MTAADQLLVKEINRTLVLDAVRRRSPVSRPEVGVLVGLGKGTVSNLVNELIEEGWVSETGFAASTGGRRAAMLMFEDSAATAIGIDIQIDGIQAIATDLRGKVLFRGRSALLGSDSDHVYKQVRALIKDMLAAVPPTRYGVAGIGVGFAGVIDENGSVVYAPSFGWRMFPLRERLVSDFDLPIHVDNEARVGALGEVELGGHENRSHIIYVSVGNGIGTGLIIGNELYRGTSGFAGEAGHMSIATGPARDSNELSEVRSWQSCASVSAIVQRARKAGFLGQTDMPPVGASPKPFDVLLHLAESGCEEVRGLFREVAVYLAVGISNLMYVMNPSHVVVGGEMARASQFLDPTLQTAVSNFTKSYADRPATVTFSRLDADATALGAASLAYNALLKGTRLA